MLYSLIGNPVLFVGSKELYKFSHSLNKCLSMELAPLGQVSASSRRGEKRWRPWTNSSTQGTLSLVRKQFGGDPNIPSVSNKIGKRWVGPEFPRSAGTKREESMRVGTLDERNKQKGENTCSRTRLR